MRIGLDYRAATVAPKSGIGRQVQALEQALLARPGDELVRFSEAPLAHAQRQTASCPPWGSPLDGLHRPKVRLKFESRFLPRSLRKEAVDLYIATVNMGLPLGRKPSGMRYVLVLHDLFQITQDNFHTSSIKKGLYRILDRLSIAWSIQQADRIWCPSEFTRQEAARLFPACRDKVRVLPNQVDGFDAVPEAALRAEIPEQFWLVVGTREPRKNIAFLLRCWYELKQSGTQLHDLVLMGCPADVPAELASLPGIHWLSAVADAELHALYRKASCLLQPSCAEGFGLPVVEACSTGTPVAVAKGSALDEVAPPGALRFDPCNADALKQCLQQLVTEPSPLSRDDLVRWAEQYRPDAYRAARKRPVE